MHVLIKGRERGCWAPAPHQSSKPFATNITTLLTISPSYRYPVTAIGAILTYVITKRPAAPDKPSRLIMKNDGVSHG